MPRAVLKNGLIHPLEPLPTEWADGKELCVEEPKELCVEEPKEAEESREEIDTWFEQLEAMCSQSNSEDDARLQAAIDQARQEAKEWMRRRMGLP